MLTGSNARYRLEKAAAKDVNFFYEVKKLVLKTYVERIWGWDEGFQLQLHIENYNPANCAIIFRDSKAIGTLEATESQDDIFINSIYLLPPYQGQGIGSAIISGFIDKAAKLHKMVSLEVLKLNVRALALYERFGFVLQDKNANKFFMYKDFRNEQDNGAI